MKTAFVLSGGGAAGAYQLGAIKALLAKGFAPDFITANSAGSLNAAGISFGSISELENIWRSIESRKDIFADRWLGLAPIIFGANSLWTSGPLKKKIDSLVLGRFPKIPFFVNYVDLRNGKLMRSWSSASDLDSAAFSKCVLASASLPILTEPVDGIYVDGGVRENTPLKLAIDEGAERIFVFLNSPKERSMEYTKSFDNIKEIAARTISIMIDDLHWNDIEECQWQNENGVGRKIELIWIAPEIGTIGTLDFSKDSISRAIAQGFTDANNKILQMDLK